MQRIYNLVFCFVILFLSLCCKDSLAQTPFKVGVILPLSGPAADYGQSMQVAMQMAREDFSTLAGGVDFIFEDAAFDPKQAVSAFKKLVENDHVDLVYVWGVTFCKPLAPIAQARKIPIILQCIDSSDDTNQEYAVRFMNSTQDYMSMLAIELKKRNLKKIAIVLSDNPYLESMYNELLKFAAQFSIQIDFIDRYLPGNFDFRASISKIKAKDYSAIGVFLGPGQISSFFKQASEQKLTLPMFGTNFFESISEIKAAQGLMDSSIYVHNYAKPEFEQRFKQVSAKASQLGFAALAYEFTSFVLQEFGQTSVQLNSQEILNRFKQIHKRQGLVTSEYNLVNSPKGQFVSFKLSLKTIKGEQIVSLE